MDVATLVLMMTVISVVKAVLLLAVGWRRHTELVLWGAGFASLGLAYAFTALRPQLPYLAGLIASNIPVGVATALMVEGLRHFLRQTDTGTRTWVWGAVLLMAVMFLVLHDSLDGRVMLSALVLTAHLGWCFMALNRADMRAYTLGRRLMQTGIFLVLLPMWWRAWLALEHHLPGLGYEKANVHWGLMIASHVVAITLLSTGILTLIQQRTRQQLANSDRQFQQLLAAASEVMCVLVQGKVQYVNPQVQRVTGYPPEALLGQSFLTFVDEQDQPLAQLKHALRQQDSGGELPPYDLRLKTKTQGVRLFEVRGSRIEWHGQPATLIALQDVTERRDQQAEMNELAFHDTLTHLANRHLLLDRLKLALANNRRHQQHSALVFLDLDQFKPLNDAHGHAVGDLLLLEVARRLQQEVRSVDTAARFGGDEFVLLLTTLDPDERVAREDALSLAERVRASLAQPYVLLPHGHQEGVTPITHHCTASIGLVVFDGHSTDTEALLQQADHAMYEAKHLGRNRVYG